MSSNPTTTEKARPVATYGKKLHTDDHSTPTTTAQSSSGFMFGADDDEEEDDNNGDFLGKSIFDKPMTASFDSNIAVTTAPAVAHSPPRDDIEMPDIPLTPRSKLAAELKIFEETQNKQKPKERVYKTPFKLIGLEDDESEEESDDAFMERFRQQMKDRDAKKSTTSTIEDTVNDNAVSSLENTLQDLPSTSLPDASKATSKPISSNVVPKLTAFSGLSEEEKESDISDSEDEQNLFVHRINPPSVLTNLPAEAAAPESASEEGKSQATSNNDLLAGSDNENDQQPAKSSLTEKTKKLTIKDKEEMERETQRMARELQLEPEIKNTNRITPASFLNKFRAKTTVNTSKPITLKSSNDGSELMSHPENSISPVTSPFASDNELEISKPKEARTPKKQTPSKPNSSPLQTRQTPIRPRWHASMMKFSPSSSRKPAPTPAGVPTGSSDNEDDDLEILPPKQSRAVRQLVNLSGLGSLTKAEVEKRRKNHQAVVNVMEKQREQILRDRHEKEEMIKKIRGEVLAEMKNSKRGDAEDEEFEREHLYEIARREAELIRKREIEAEKKKVENVEIPSEDEEIQIDFDEEDEKMDNGEDDELVVPFDQEAEDDNGEDEQEDDEDMEEAEPEEPVLETKISRRRTQVLEDDEDEDDNPFASQNSQFKSSISMTQMFQQTQDAPSNSQKLKIGDFSSDEDEDEVIPATQLGHLGSNSNTSSGDSIGNDGFELRTQKKVNFDFDTDILPTQLSQFPEPTQVNMVQRPDMMDIVEGLRRPDVEKPGLRRKNKLSDNNAHDNAATQADFDNSLTQAIVDSTVPTSLNDMTQKIIPTAPDATQKIAGTATDTQAIPFLETQAVPQLSAQTDIENDAKEQDDEDESDNQRIIMRRHKQSKLVKEKKPKNATLGRELADEEAVESEDEWAGMGGNSDDEIDPEMAEELKQMVDDDESGINKSKDEAALQKLFATKKRNEDQEMEGRLQDVVTGDWRKKKAKGGLLDLSDDEEIVFGEEDDIETQKYNRRLKKAMERRKRKLLENDKLAAMKNDPKKLSFMKVIEGENSFMDTKRYFADADSSDDELEIVETQSAEDTQEEASNKAASAEPSIAMPPPALLKRPNSVSSATTERPAKKRRSEVEYIRQTLSFLDENKSDHDGSENEDGAWDPSRTLGDAIDPEQLVSDDEDDGDSLLQDETPLGEPSMVHRSTRVVNLIQERRSLTGGIGSVSASAIDISDDETNGTERGSVIAATDNDDDDDVVFKCSKFRSSVTSITQARDENNKGFADVVVGKLLAGVGSKSSINYKKRHLAGPGGETAETRITRMRFEAVDKVIASRKQSSVLLSRKSGGSWMEE